MGELEAFLKKRKGGGTQPRELRAALAGLVPRPRRGDLSGQDRGHPRRTAFTYAAVPRARAAGFASALARARRRARATRSRSWRPTSRRCSRRITRVPMAGRGAERAQLPPRRAHDRLLLEHGEAKVLIADREFAPVVARRCAARSATAARDRHRRSARRRAASASASVDYEAFLADGDPGVRAARPGRRVGRDRAASTPRARPAIPKGVVYHHRGAYLNALGNALTFGLAPRSRSICGRCRCSTATAGPTPGP